MDIFFQLLLNGIVIGSYYILIALGLSIIFGVLDIPHFAHGSVAMFSGYIAYLVVSNYNASIFVAIIVSIIFATIIGVILEIVAYRPVVNAPPINSFIIALALMMVIDNVATVVFGSNQVSIRSASNEVFSLGSVSLSEHRLYLLLTTFILVTGLYL